MDPSALARYVLIFPYHAGKIRDKCVQPSSVAHECALPVGSAMLFFRGHVSAFSYFSSLAVLYHHMLFSLAVAGLRAYQFLDMFICHALLAKLLISRSC